jgi:hypothetical protein
MANFLFKLNITNRSKGVCDLGLRRFFTFFALLQNWAIWGTFSPRFLLILLSQG